MLDISFSFPTLDIVKATLLIFCLRLCDVSLGTWRLIEIAHGRRRTAGILGFCEISIWVFAISNVMHNLGNIWLILGYSMGFSMGTVLGMWIEEKMAIGNVLVSVVSPDKGEEIARRLRDHSFRVMQYAGSSEGSSVQILTIIVPRKRLPLSLREIQFIDPAVMITVEDLRMAKVPTLPIR